VVTGDYVDIDVSAQVYGPPMQIVGVRPFSDQRRVQKIAQDHQPLRVGIDEEAVQSFTIRCI
jgi:hypothetical protein